MIVFELCKSKFSNDLSGKEAERSGGRWNSKGVPMVYTCASRALCTVEIAVRTPLNNIPTDYELVTIILPDHSIIELEISRLGPDWKSFPHSDSTQKLGDEFVSNGWYLVMKVPSAIVQDEFNYLVNPNHGDFKKINIVSIEPFNLDNRLFKR